MSSCNVRIGLRAFEGEPDQVGGVGSVYGAPYVEACQILTSLMQRVMTGTVIGLSSRV